MASRCATRSSASPDPSGLCAGLLHEQGDLDAVVDTALALWMVLPLLIGVWRITRREVSA